MTLAPAAARSLTAWTCLWLRSTLPLLEVTLEKSPMMTASAVLALVNRIVPKKFPTDEDS